MNAAEILQGAIEVLRKDDWCRGALGRDKREFMTAPNAPSCCARCALGAIYKVLNTDGLSDRALFNAGRTAMPVDEAYRALTVLADTIEPDWDDYRSSVYTPLTNFNDIEADSVEEVIEVFHRAIETLEETTGEYRIALPAYLY